MDGVAKLRVQAQLPVKLAEEYPSGQTKAVLLRAAAALFEHADVAFNVDLFGQEPS